MIKIYYSNFLKYYTQTTAASTGQSTVQYIYDLDRETEWSSVGSDDLTEETITIEFDQLQTIDSIGLLNMNFKEYDVMYDSSGWTAFSSAINETANTLTSKFYTVTPVSTMKVRLRARKTIVANEEKTLMEFYVGGLIGEFISDLTSKPNSYDAGFNANVKIITKSNGGKIRYTRGEKYFADVKLKEVYETADQDILNTMFDYGEFAIYPCGGDTYTQKGWRIEDLYHVIIDGDNSASFSVGRVASMGLDYKFKLYEL